MWPTPSPWCGWRGTNFRAIPQRLIDETQTVGLFGGERVVWVRAGSRNFVPALEPVLEVGGSTLVVVEAGTQEGAPLRTLCEASPKALCHSLLCGRRPRSRQAGGHHALRGGPCHRPRRQGTPRFPSSAGDRLASRGEIAKLALYAQGQGRVTLEDVRVIVGDASALALDDVVDSTSPDRRWRRPPRLPRPGARRPARRGARCAVAGALFAAPDGLAGAGGTPADRVIDQARPMVHFSRKPKAGAGAAQPQCRAVSPGHPACGRSGAGRPCATPAMAIGHHERVVLQLSARR